MGIRLQAHKKGTLLLTFLVPAVALSLTASFVGERGRLGSANTGATNSAPLALTRNDRFLWVANPENNSVTLMEVGNDANRKIKELRVGEEPQSVAITPDDRKVYVTNMVSGTVSVIDALQQKVLRIIPVGTEPFGCALTPDGKKLYVANFSSDSVSVIDTALDKVIRTIENVGPKPRAIAVNTDGKVYVTQFLAQLRPDARPITQKEGADDGKEGRVTVLSSATDTVTGTVVLNPIANTGFLSNGSTLGRVPLRNNANGQQIFDTVTGAFPNLLQGIAIKNGKAYLPNTGSSPNGPVRFNVNVQSLIAAFDTATDLDANVTLNMNRGVQFEPVGQRLFPTNPIAIAFKKSSNIGFVTSGATNRILKVTLNDSGAPTINAPVAANDPGNIKRVEVGKDPIGIVLNSTDTRAYVLNLISRDVSVVNVANDTPTKITDIPSAALPPSGTLAAIIHRGHELFVTSIGPAGTNENALPPAGRMSDFGWGTCYSCHPSGLTDGVTWMFGDGPRQTISMESTGEHPQPLSAQLNAFGAPVLPLFRQRVLNWSAVREEVQDFELNIRGVSGGQGLIALANGAQDPCVFNLVIPPNVVCPPEFAITTGRSADLDALAAYTVMGIRAPISPLRPKNFGGGQLVDFDLLAGRALFNAANCQQCHGGPNWTRSRVDFVPPPLGETIVAGQLTRFLVPVGTFDANLFNDGVSNEIRANQAANVIANGGLGFNIPSLISVFAGAPYFHSGAAPTLDAVMDNVTHRAAGTGGVDTLSNPSDRQRVVKFLKSIDLKTPPFP